MTTTLEHITIRGSRPAVFTGSGRPDIRKFVIDKAGAFASGDVYVGLSSNAQYHSDIAEEVGMRPIGGGRLAIVNSESAYTTLEAAIADAWSTETPLRYVRADASNEQTLVLFSESGSYGRENDAVLAQAAQAICEAYNVKTLVRL